MTAQYGHRIAAGRIARRRIAAKLKYSEKLKKSYYVSSKKKAYEESQSTLSN